MYNADGEIIKSTENITNDDLVYMGTLTPKYFSGFLIRSFIKDCLFTWGSPIS